MPEPMLCFVNVHDGRVVSVFGARAEPYRAHPEWREVTVYEAARLQLARLKVIGEMGRFAQTHEHQPVPRVKHVRVSATIMSHPAREHLEERLREAIRWPITTIVDDGIGPWKTARAAWLTSHKNATHHVVFEDDAVPCHDLMCGMRVALEAVPNQVVSFFSFRRWADGKSPISLARKVGSSWGTCDIAATNVAIAMPTCWISEWLAFCARHIKPECPVQSVRLDCWLAMTKRRCWFTVPSLVDHDDDGSLMWGKKFGENKRRAELFIGRSVPGDIIDWRNGSAKPPHCKVGERPWERYAVWYQE